MEEKRADLPRSFRQDLDAVATADRATEPALIDKRARARERLPDRLAWRDRNIKEVVHRVILVGDYHGIPGVDLDLPWKLERWLAAFEGGLRAFWDYERHIATGELRWRLRRRARHSDQRDKRADGEQES